MSDATNVSAVELLQSLDAKEIEERINALDSENAALRSLLRSIRARERARRLRDARPNREPEGTSR